MARPEANGGEYYEPYDQEAWQDFTPWRPGDASPTDTPSPAAAGEHGSVGRGPARQDDGTAGTSTAGAAAAEQDATRRGRWWTEDAPRAYQDGDRVRSTRAIGGGVFSHVPAGTKGEVVKVEKTLLGEDKLTVDFGNSYTEQVKASDLTRDSWWG